jgi:hypothetical protein
MICVVPYHALNYTAPLRIRLLQSFNGFAVWQDLQKKIYLGHIGEFERKKNACQV